MIYAFCHKPKFTWPNPRERERVREDSDFVTRIERVGGRVRQLHRFRIFEKSCWQWTEMDALRKQLDVLMGANRNGDSQEVTRKYFDRDVCRLYLAGLCSHELFQLTVRIQRSCVYRCMHSVPPHFAKFPRFSVAETAVNRFSSFRIWASLSCTQFF